MKNQTVLFGLVAVFLLGLHTSTNALAAETVRLGPKIIWSCKKPGAEKNVLWLVEWGPKSYIKALNERIPARYVMEGLEKRWDWALDETDRMYSYTITLTPDLVAKYYDFKLSQDRTAKAKSRYHCEK